MDQERSNTKAAASNLAHDKQLDEAMGRMPALNETAPEVVLATESDDDSDSFNAKEEDMCQRVVAQHSRGRMQDGAVVITSDSDDDGFENDYVAFA
jgi:hypothetical protein